MNGEDLNDVWIELLRHQHQRNFLCVRTCRRWIHQHQGEGHTHHRWSTGNRFSKREVHIHRQDLANLAVYQTVQPKAYIDKVRAYVHNQNPANLLYSQSQIGRAELRLGLNRKAASTTSDCAYFQVNLHKQVMYWNVAFPDGVSRESTRDVIDIKESNYEFNASPETEVDFLRWSRRKCTVCHDTFAPLFLTSVSPLTFFFC